MGKEMIDRLSVRVLQADEIKTLHREWLTRDFPPEEQKPLSMIMNAVERDAYICYGAMAEESIFAYAFFMKHRRDALVDYYAVREDLRGEGIGSRFMQELINGPLQAMNCFLLETEDPDFARNMQERDTRNRRLNFYKRNGLVETGLKATVRGVPYYVLELPLGERHSAETIRTMYTGIYHVAMPGKDYSERVRIG